MRECGNSWAQILRQSRIHSLDSMLLYLNQCYYGDSSYRESLQKHLCPICDWFLHLPKLHCFFFQALQGDITCDRRSVSHWATKVYLEDVAPHVLHDGRKTLRVDVLLQGTAVPGKEGDEGTEPLLNGAVFQLQLQQKWKGWLEKLVHLETHTHTHKIKKSTHTETFFMF